MTGTRVVFMCGPAGTGKTTVARALSGDGFVRVSVDAQAHARGWPGLLTASQAAQIDTSLRDRITALIEAGCDVVLDFSFATRATRDDYRALVAPLTPVVVFVRTPRDVALARVAGRTGDAADEVALDLGHAARYFDEFDVPTADEGPLIVVDGERPLTSPRYVPLSRATRMTRIEVAAVVLPDGLGRIATVRKRGTSRFMFPGGKLNTGETPAQAGARETAEELGVTLDPADLAPLGTFTAAAANEPDTLVVAHVFVAPPGARNAQPAAEIADLRWLDLDSEADTHQQDLAPLLTQAVIPALRSDQILHGALPPDWAAAQESGVYVMSTRGASIADVGFLHGSAGPAQLKRVRAAFYADVNDLVVLSLSTARLEHRGHRVRMEAGEPGGTELFPHVYGGAIELDCVLAAR